MGKELWKPGNMVDPLPAVMVSCADKEGHDNIITIAWTDRDNLYKSGNVIYICASDEIFLSFD